MWAGIAGTVINNNTALELAISIHDSVYNTDFASSTVPYNPNNPEEQASNIEKHVLELLRKFATEHMCKFLGAGVTVSLLREVRSPCSDLDGARKPARGRVSRTGLALRSAGAAAGQARGSRYGYVLMQRSVDRRGPSWASFRCFRRDRLHWQLLRRVRKSQIRSASNWDWQAGPQPGSGTHAAAMSSSGTG